MAADRNTGTEESGEYGFPVSEYLKNIELSNQMTKIYRSLQRSMYNISPHEVGDS